MSIILDALKKAESERHLGQLPGLHTPRSTTSEVPSVSVSLRTRVLWCAIAVAMVLMAMAAWWFANMALRTPVNPTPQVPPPLSLAQSVMPIQPTQSIQPASMQQSPVIATASRDIPVPPPLPAPAAKPVATVPAKPAPSVTMTREAPPKQIAAAAAPDKIMMMAELPPALQRELPPLVIGGSMYSDNAAERMLLVDKRLLHEGDEVAPNLVLEKLMPKEAVLRFRGTRFRIAF